MCQPDPRSDAFPPRPQSLALLQIGELDLEGEFFTVTNSTSEHVDLTGFHCLSGIGNQFYTFTAGAARLDVGGVGFPGTGQPILGPGHTVRVWSGKGARGHATKHSMGQGPVLSSSQTPPRCHAELVWTERFIWNNHGDEAVLQNAAGDTLDSKSAKPVEAVHDSAVGDSLAFRLWNGAMNIAGLSGDTILVHELDLDNEYVQLMNVSSSSIDLNGYAVQNHKHKRYVFTEQTVVPSGGVIGIWAGRGSRAAANSDHRPNVHWTERYMWNNHGDEATVFDPDGHKLASRKEGNHPHPVAPPADTLKMEFLDLKDEIFSVLNTSEHAVQLRRCTVTSTTGGQVFRFGDTVLAPGSTVHVYSGKHSGSGVRKHKDGMAIKWTNRYIWNDHGDEAVLCDPTGRAIHAIKAPALTDAAKTHKKSHKEAPDTVGDTGLVNASPLLLQGLPVLLRTFVLGFIMLIVLHVLGAMSGGFLGPGSDSDSLLKSDREYLEEVFHTLDMDKNGKIELWELQKANAEPGPAEQQPGEGEVDSP